MKRLAWLMAIFLVLAPSLSACRGSKDRAVQEKLSLAQELEQDGRADDAYPVYEEVLSLAPCSHEAFFRLGIRDYVRGDYARARERFENCVRCDRDHVLCWERLAWSLEKLSAHEEAARAYREAFGVRPDREFLEGEGLALTQAGKLHEAASVFRRIREAHPEDHRAVYFLGNVLLKQGDREGARGLYEKAIEMRPVLVEAYVNLASILFEEGKYAEAAGLMEKTLDILPMDAPFDPRLRYNIAASWFQAGDRERAEKHLSRYLELAPQGDHAEAARGMLESLEARDGHSPARETPSSPPAP